MPAQAGARRRRAPFTERLTRDSANLPATREEIVQTAERLLDQAQAALPRAFGKLPEIPCTVKPIEEYRERDSVAAFYYPPAGDGSRPGIFYVNTYDPPSRPRHTMPALTFHEAVPGHHLQIALSTEAKDLPECPTQRRERYRPMSQQAWVAACTLGV